MTRPMSRSTFLRTLSRLGACQEAMKWCRKTKGTPGQLWAKCPNARWMFWLLGALYYDRKAIVLAACDCARLALVHVPAGEERPLRCIETTEAWARGEATIEQVHAANRLAWQAWKADAASAYDASAYAATAAHAAHAAHAATAAYAATAAHAAHAATAASAAAADAATAANAAYDAYDAADAAAYDAARAKTLRKCAILVRKRIPARMVAAALAQKAGR